MPTRHRAALLAVLLCLPLVALAGKGRLEIASEPGGAKVLINGEWRGNTSTDPAKALVLPVREGPYRVEAVIEASGQRDVQEVYVAEDAVQPVRLRLAIVPETIDIPAGSFLMGSPDDEPGRVANEGPRHRVQVPAFALGKYEVTFAQGDACVADGGCRHRPEDEGWGRGNRPVINVSWDDAQEYVNWLSRKTGQTLAPA